MVLVYVKLHRKGAYRVSRGFELHRRQYGFARISWSCQATFGPLEMVEYHAHVFPSQTELWK